MKRWPLRIKQPFSSLSHAVGALLAVAALLTLLYVAQGRPWHVVSFVIYGGSLIALYTASTLYHSLPVAGPQEDRLRRFDQCAIYLLIAGSYTPICLLSLHGPWGWSLLAVEYALATVGIILNLVWKSHPERLRVATYVCMGWLVVVALAPLRQALPPAALAWLIGGGVAYSVGTIIYATDRPHLWPGKFSAHDLWHLFVLGGSACHFVMMLRFVAVSA